MRADLGMLLGRGHAELEHLAEDRDRTPTAALTDRRQRVERGVHGGGVGVVAVVDDDQAVGPLVERHPPRGQGPGRAERGDDRRRRGRRPRGHGRGRGRVRDLVGAGLEQAQRRPVPVVPELEGGPAQLVELDAAPDDVAGDPEGTAPAPRSAGAMAATRSSSAFSTAVPSAGRASTISPLACAIASREPNSPMWAVPTLRTAATSGGAIAQSSAMWPMPRAPISRTR